MAQSTDNEFKEHIEELESKKAEVSARVARLDRERTEAKEMLDKIEASRKAAIFQALDSIKKKYFHRLLGRKGVKVRAPRLSAVEESTLGKITTIPKIAQRNMNEIEIQPTLKNYSYVRVLYDTLSNEYFYEAIEPKLLEEEAELLEVLKEILVENLELLEEEGRQAKENYLRRIVDGLIRELGVELHPVSKERILYYVFRDFMRYGPIDVVMTDPQVEDVSCDGVRENPFTPLDLVRFKTMSPEMMGYLWLAIENGQSMLICGGTASGKTTTLNAILLFIPPQMKIVSIEDTRELNLPHENWVPLLTRAGFGGKSVSTGKAAGEIDMFDLLIAALPQRPQYLMVGETD